MQPWELNLSVSTVLGKTINSIYMLSFSVEYDLLLRKSLLLLSNGLCVVSGVSIFISLSGHSCGEFYVLLRPCELISKMIYFSV